MKEISSRARWLKRNGNQLENSFLRRKGGNRGKKGKGQVKEHVYKGPMDKDNGGGGLNVRGRGGQGRGE